MEEGDLDFAATAASSLSSAVSIGSANVKEPLLQGSMRMKRHSTNHLVTDEYGSVQPGKSFQPSPSDDPADSYSPRDYHVGPGLGGIQFHLEPDSTTVSGEYVNIMDDDGERPTSPTTVALQKCKRTVIKPYLRSLSLLGWFPIIPDNGSRPHIVRVLNFVYTLLAVCLIFFAYVVQFAACFRRDGAFQTHSNGTVSCYSNAIGSYLVPDILHSAAYIYAFYIFRYQQSENLVTLMERVFLQSALGQSGYHSQDRLILRLRNMLRFNFLWVVLSLMSQIIHLVGISLLKQGGGLSFTWMNVTGEFWKVFLAIMMVFGFIALDIVYAAIVTNYATHCELLIIMIRSMSTRVLQKTISLQDVMREIMIAQKYLKYTNESVATAVSLLMFNFGAAIVIGIQSAAGQRNDFSMRSNGTLFAATVISIVLWFTMFMIPLIQAARLSTACWSLGKIGQEVATRPFGFQTAPQDEITAFLMFTTSLQLRAKLFRIPIRSAYLLVVLVAGGFAFMVLLTVSPQLQLTN